MNISIAGITLMFLKIYIVVFSTVLLSSCNFSPTIFERLKDYQESLNRYKGLSIPLVEQRFPEHRLPLAKNRKQTLSEFDVSLIEFLALQGCDTGYLIGQKNSGLGKVMADSQRLIYEVNLIRSIDYCVIESPSLAKKIKAIAVIKRKELSKVFANAVWGADESQRFFSVSNGTLPMTFIAADVRLLEDALRRLISLGESLDGLPNIKSSRIEEDLQTIYHSEFAGRLILTLILVTDALNITAQHLDDLQIDEDFCQGPMRFLKQQFRVHYLEGLQPYMARISSATYAILTNVARLQKVSGELPQDMQTFLQQYSLLSEAGQWKQYQQANQLHAQSWDRLLRQCNLF